MLNSAVLTLRHLLLLGLVTVLAVILPRPAQALDIALCREADSLASFVPARTYNGVDGGPLYLVVGDTLPDSAQCERLSLPVAVGELLWSGVIAPETGLSGQDSGYLLQGLLNSRTQVSVSEVSALGGGERNETRRLSYGVNLLASSSSLVFGREERASWTPDSGLTCRAGSSPAGVQFFDSGSWPDAADAQLFVEAQGSGQFPVAVSDETRIEAEAPLLIGQLSLGTASDSLPHRLELPPSESPWQALTILCPDSEAHLSLAQISVMPGTSGLEPAGDAGESTRSAWLWSPQLWQNDTDQLWEITTEQDLSEVYLTIPVGEDGRLPVERLDTFLLAAQERGITVWPVIGDRRDVMNANWAALQNRITSYARFNASTETTGKLEGVQLDIEPYLISGFELSPAYWREQYIETIEFARASVGPSVDIDLVVPVWWGSHPDFGEAFLDRLAPYQVSLTIMNYRTDVQQLILGAEPFVAWGQRHDRQVSIGLEAGSIGDEQQHLYRPNEAAGHLWQFQIGEHTVLAMFSEELSALPGTAFERYQEREFSGSNISFRGDLQRINAVAGFLNANFADRASFRGISLHGLDEVYRARAEPAFPDLQGPSHVTPLPALPQRTPLSAYSGGSRDSLGLYVLDETSSWLGLVHGLKSAGIPVRVVSDIDQALEHDVLMIYPMLAGSNLESESLQRLAEFVRSGHSLLAFSVLGGGMQSLFGFEAAVEHAHRQEFRFSDSEFSERFIAVPEESTVQLAPDLESQLAADSETTLGMPGVSFTDPRREPIAIYADNTAAITHNFFTTESGVLGHAYAIGIDLGHFILRAHNGRFSGYTEDYVNGYKPSIDTALRFLESVYRQGEPDAVMLSPVPDGRTMTVLLTHDVDFSESLENTEVYAQAEFEQSVPATYFLQTKYVRDYYEESFFNTSTVPVLQNLLPNRAEVASHTVSHSNEFRAMPPGTGTERYPEYRPFVQDFTTVNDASVLGELRVSKFLIETATGREVRAFRPGHLSLPQNLPEMLQASGYDFSSSITANEVLTHLPFRLMHSRAFDAEVDVFEFPITFEDEQWTLEDNFAEVLSVARKIGRHGGLVNVLIHTEETGDKLAFQRDLVEALREEAHFSGVSQFGDWWVARDSVLLDLVQSTPQLRQLQVTSARPLTGLTLELPETWRYEGGLAGSEQIEDQLILGQLTDTATLSFSIDSD